MKTVTGWGSLAPGSESDRASGVNDDVSTSRTARLTTCSKESKERPCRLVGCAADWSLGPQVPAAYMSPNSRPQLRSPTSPVWTCKSVTNRRASTLSPIEKLRSALSLTDTSVPGLSP